MSEHRDAVPAVDPHDEPERGPWLDVRRVFYGTCWLLLLVGFLTVPMPFFTLSPGGAVEVDELVEVDGVDGMLQGEVALLAVSIRAPSLFELLDARLDEQVDIAARDAILPPDEDRGDYFDRQRKVFADALTTSAAVALRAAGEDVVVRSLPEVVQVLPNGPSVGVLAPGDLVTRINGVEVATADELVAEARTLDDGDLVRLEVLRDEQPLSLELRAGQVGRMPRPGLGITVDTTPREVELPYDVRLREGVEISGPSAGLMFAVTIYDLVAEEDLLAGRRVAGTGTLGLDGRVGRIGSIEQKVFAAMREGYQVFLAPASQAAEARAVAGPDLLVVPVETFADALTALRTAPDAV